MEAKWAEINPHMDQQTVLIEELQARDDERLDGIFANSGQQREGKHKVSVLVSAPAVSSPPYAPERTPPSSALTTFVAHDAQNELLSAELSDWRDAAYKKGFNFVSDVLEAPLHRAATTLVSPLEPVPASRGLIETLEDSGTPWYAYPGISLDQLACMHDGDILADMLRSGTTTNSALLNKLISIAPEISLAHIAAAGCNGVLLSTLSEAGVDIATVSATWHRQDATSSAKVLVTPLDFVLGTCESLQSRLHNPDARPDDTKAYFPHDISPESRSWCFEIVMESCKRQDLLSDTPAIQKNVIIGKRSTTHTHEICSHSTISIDILSKAPLLVIA